MLWGSNAREAHPIFFHHVLKAVHRGAKLMVVDPRRTVSAQWADLWLGLDVGTDIPLANAIAREIIHTGLANEEFIARATTGFDAFRESVEPWTLDEAERVTGVPAEAIRELAHALGTAENPQICWTLGITEHHNARRQRLRADQPRAARRRRRPLRRRAAAAARPEQRAGRRRHGRDPEQAARLPGRRGRRHSRAKFEAAWGATVPPENGLHLTGMFEAMEHGDLRALYVDRREPGAVGGRPARARETARGGSTISSCRTSS